MSEESGDLLEELESSVSGTAEIKSETLPACQLLKIKTPSQLNGGVRRIVVHSNSKQPLPKQVLVKRLGSTSIMARSSSADMKDVLNKLTPIQSSQLTNSQHVIRVQKNLNSLQMARPIISQQVIRTSAKDAKDVYISQLEDQNRELKTMLLECRRECGQIQLKMRKWTLNINEALNRVSTFGIGARPLSISKPATIKPYYPPPQQQQQSSPGPVPSGSKLVAKKSTAHLPSDIPFITPAFPIQRLDVFQQFEIDLKNREYFEFVFQKIFNQNSKAQMMKPLSLMSTALEAIVSLKLFASFIWDQSCPHPINVKPIYFRTFVRFKMLYGRLVNNLSNLVYGKNVDFRSVEQFLRSKLYTQAKLQNSQNNLKTKKEVLTLHQRLQEIKARSHESEQMKTESDSLKEDSEESDNDGKMIMVPHVRSQIKWIDDEPEGDNSEEGNDILGDNDDTIYASDNSDTLEDRKSITRGKVSKNAPNESRNTQDQDMEFLSC